MPTPPQPSASDLRRSLAALTTLAKTEIAALLRQVTAAEARDALADVLPELVEKYGSAAASIASDWYDDRREAAAVRGLFQAIPAEPRLKNPERLAGWAVGPMFGENPNVLDATNRVGGRLMLTIFDAGRETIMDSSFADSRSRGWMREASGETCEFCLMLAGRGEVYSEASVDFASHASCDCVGVPAFDGLADPVDVKPYQKSARNISDSSRANVREWIANNPQG